MHEYDFMIVITKSLQSILQIINLDEEVWNDNDDTSPPNFGRHFPKGSSDICFVNGLFKEYRWLLNEYNKSWDNPLKYSELTPKELKLIVNKYKSELHQNKTKKLKFEKENY